MRVGLIATVVALMAAIACDSNVVEPSRLPLEGLWVGTYTVTTCIGGSDFRACPRLPTLANLSLRIPSGGTNWQGVLTLDIPTPSATSAGAFREDVPLPVSGTQSESGVVEIRTGTVFGQSPCGPETVTLDWRSVISNRSMTGTVTVVTYGHYPGFCFVQSFTVVGTLTATSRSAVREMNR